MYADRDFDPDNILARRDREARHRRGSGEHETSLQCLLPWNEEALSRDLGVDVTCDAMAAGDKFLFDAAKTGLLASLGDAAAIGYRQGVLADALKNPSAVRDMYRIAVDAIEGERKNYWSFFARYPSGILHRAVDVMQGFVGSLKQLRAIADRHGGGFQSEGFCRLFATLQRELADEYFAEIERHLRRLKFRDGVLISARLGKGNKGTDYVLRTPKPDTRGWLARLLADKAECYTYHLHPRDEAGARALSELSDRGVNLVANALAQSADRILSFFQMLRAELAFYVGCLNLHHRLAGLGELVCMPAAAPAGRRTLAFSGLYDVSLALSMGRRVVGNDLDADRKDLIIITGANTGGKSTFLRSFGLAQLMLQAGMFVGAEHFAAEICCGVYTHYRREEDAEMESGKWDEELTRMSAIIDRIRPNALMLFNESFASTNQREGAEIAGQIVGALLDRGVKVAFVTHLYDLAAAFLAGGRDRVKFLRAERRPDGSRPFRLVEAEPLPTSYGEDLYRTIFLDDEQAPPAPALSKASRVG
jgi:hypothetical protein